MFAGRLPGRVTLTGLSRFSDLNPPLSEGLSATDGFAAGLVAGLATVVLGLRSSDAPADGRLTVPEGLVEAEGFAAAGCFVPTDGLVVVDGLVAVDGFVPADCFTVLDELLFTCVVLRLTVADDFEADGVVVLEVVPVVPVVRDSPLRACASASDSNATNDKAAIIAASAVLIVLIIVQF